MAKTITSSPTMDIKTLRQRAETLLRAKPADMPTMPTEDVQALVHELNVHQIELEIQNEELRQSQLELAHARDRYSDLYDFAPVGYLTLDKDGRILEANLSAATFLGIERKSLLGASLSNWIDRDFQDAFFSYRREVFADNARQICEVNMHKSDGTPRAVRLESIAQDTGHQRQCRTALIDVTKQQAAQSALRQFTETLEQRVVEQTHEVQLLAAAVSHLAEGVVITDDELDWPGPRIRFVNSAMCRITGYTADELVGQTPRLLQGEQTDRATCSRIKSELSAGRAVLCEFINYRKDGTPYDAELYINPLFNSEGHRTNFVSVHRDITEHKKLERSLKESESRLRAILTTAAEAIITIDQRGIIDGVNSATEQMFGYAREELVGQNVRMLMPAPYSNQYDDYLARYLQSVAASTIGVGRDVTGCHKEGSTFPISLAVSEVKHFDLFTVIVHDMSERHKLQREVLGIAEDEQRRIGQDLHDSVQQELAGLGMMAQTLLENLSKETDKPHDGQASRHRELATKIVNGIARTHQEVQAIARGLVPVRIDTQGLMNALRELAIRADDLEGVTCAFKCEQPVEIADSFTATHLYRIAQEAMTNALKHGQPEHILIALESDAGQPILLVADDGIGLELTEQIEGMGLKTMLYRASLIGANLTVNPVENGGTLVRCQVFPRDKVTCHD